MRSGRILAVCAGLALALSPARLLAQSPTEIFRTVFEQVWSTGSFDGVDELIAPDMQFHYGGRSSPMTPDRMRQMVTNWRTAFPDLRFELNEVVSEGERVAGFMTFTGTHRGEMFGVAPTGRNVRVTLSAVIRVRDGRMTDMWEVYDHAGLMQQLTAETSR